jgi:hypothetical protein
MDTGEDREIKGRVEAREAEIVRESKSLASKLKERKSTQAIIRKKRTTAKKRSRSAAQR